MNDYSMTTSVPTNFRPYDNSTAAGVSSIYFGDVPVQHWQDPPAIMNPWWGVDRPGDGLDPPNFPLTIPNLPPNSPATPRPREAELEREVERLKKELEEKHREPEPSKDLTDAVIEAME